MVRSVAARHFHSDPLALVRVVLGFGSVGTRSLGHEKPDILEPANDRADLRLDFLRRPGKGFRELGGRFLDRRRPVAEAEDERRGRVEVVDVLVQRVVDDDLVVLYQDREIVTYPGLRRGYRSTPICAGAERNVRPRSSEPCPRRRGGRCRCRPRRRPCRCRRRCPLYPACRYRRDQGACPRRHRL
jgi:hypothetical protein